MVRGWLARGVDGFRLDVFNAFLKHPDLPSNPTRPGTTAWARQVHVYDRDQPDFPELIGRFRAILDERARPDVGRRAVRRHGRDRGRLDDRPPSRLRLGAARVAVDGRRDPGGDRGARGGLRRRDRWPTVVLSNHDQPRHASRLAGLDRRRRPRRDRAGRGRPAADHARARRSCTTARSSGCGDVDVPPDGERRPAGRPRSARTSTWWDRSRCRTPMPWTAGSRRRVHDRPAVAAARTRRGDTRNVAAQARRPGLGPVAVSPADRAPGGDAGAPGRRRCGSSPTATDDVVAYTRGGRGPGRRSSSSTSAGAAASWRLPDVPGGRGWRPSARDRRRIRRRRRATGRRHRRSTSRRTRRASSRRIALTGTRRRPCYHDGRSTPRYAGEHHVPLDFLKRKGNTDAAPRRRPPRRRLVRACCPRRSSPRTTSSSCTTRARAARASG